MNGFDWVDDSAIAAAFERRAARGSTAGLSDAIVAQTASAAQVRKSRWLRMPELAWPQRGALVLSVVVASLLAVLLGILIVGQSKPARLGLLVYARDGDVYIAEPDGSHPVLVAHDDAIAFRNPVWSPAGRWVALSGSDGEFLLDTESVTIRRLPGIFAAWSSDGHSLALIAEEPSGPVNGQQASFLRIVDVDTGATRDVRASTGESIGGPVAWSPDGRWFLAEVSAIQAVSGADREWFALIDAASGTVRKIVALHHLNHGDAAWAHDSTHFIYTSYEPCPQPGCKGVLVVQDAALQTPVTLGDAGQPYGSESGIWSPDDQWLAFRSEATLSISHPDGSGLRVLLVDPPLQTSLSWNADGTALEYVDLDPANHDTQIHEIDIADRSITIVAPRVKPPIGTDDYAWQTIVGDARIPDLPGALPSASRVPVSGPALARPAAAPDADPVARWRGLGLSSYCSAGVLSFTTWEYTVVGTACSEGPGVSWSPIGGAYATDDGDGSLTITRPDGTSVMTPKPPRPALVPTSSAEIVWSPNGGWLSYVVEGLDEQSLTPTAPMIVMVAADGTGVRTLPGRPSWSPDGSHVAVQDTTGQLLAGHADATDLAPIGVFPPPVTWAPDGRTFAFIRDGDVWTVGIDGQNLQNLTKFPLGGASGAAWSPDGRSIIVLQGSQLWVISMDGTRIRSLQTKDRGYVEDVTWSPDGARFAVSTSDGLAIVEIADWSGTLLEGVTGRVFWSPDSNFAAFLDFAGPVSIANADGSGFHQLWTTTGDTSAPSGLAWLP